MKRGFFLSHESASGIAALNGGHPSELVAAIFGSETIVLEGFAPEPMPSSWLRPHLRFVPADVSLARDGIGGELSARAKAILWTRRGIGAAILVCLLSLTFWFGIASRPAPTEASSRWYVGGVGAQGVIVNSDSVVLLVAPGETLPNGEILQAVIPERSTYVTDHATVIVQGRQPSKAVANPPASSASR